MQELTNLFERRTTADAVFERLHSEIVSLEQLPGTKLSEAEVARRFGVSRQPVREAFNRLSVLELVLVRPQKATVVRGFSMQRMAHARFIRLAVELEVVTQACLVWNASSARLLQQNLAQQKNALDSSYAEFHLLDQQFHMLICELAGCPLAIDAITQCRKNIDRLCALSLARKNEANTVLDDHIILAAALESKSTAQAVEITRTHLGRLDSTIDEIHQSHSEYFETQPVKR